MTEATLLPMTTSLAGKVALITGGGVRVGRAIALALAQRGANIAFTHLSCEEGAQTADEIAGLGVGAMALILDVCEPGAPARVVEQEQGFTEHVRWANQRPRVAAGLSPHAPYTCSREMVAMAAQSEDAKTGGQPTQLVELKAVEPERPATFEAAGMSMFVVRSDVSPTVPETPISRLRP